MKLPPGFYLEVEHDTFSEEGPHGELIPRVGPNSRFVLTKDTPTVYSYESGDRPIRVGLPSVKLELYGDREQLTEILRTFLENFE